MNYRIVESPNCRINQLLLSTIIILLVVQVGHAQYDSTIALPMKGRLVFYERSVTVDAAIKKEVLYDRAMLWGSEAFVKTAEPRSTDGVNSSMTFAGVFKITINDSGDFYWMTFTVAISVANGMGTIQVYDFYEKPTFKGVTNDFSKIEYRWRDFKKGKPWFASDRNLFLGLNEQIEGVFSGFEEVLMK